MDHRLSYVVGDFLASLLLGIVVGVISWLIVGQSWNMWVAMFLMMPIGMFAGLISFFLLAAKLGAMEAMLPLMFTGMLAGMVVGMGAAMRAMPWLDAVLLGAASGLAGIVFIWICNALLRGVTREGEESRRA